MPDEPYAEAIIVSENHAANARDYFGTVRRRYEEYQAHAGENQLAMIRHYTPAGQEVRVLNVGLNEGSGTLLLRGEFLGPGGALAPCDVVVQPQSANLVITLVTFAEEPPEPERRPVGFRVEPQPG